MQNKQYLIVASIVFIGILIGSVGLVYVLLPQQSAPTVATNPTVKNELPEVHLYKRRGGGGLTLAWTNLPEGTTNVNIFRAPRGTEKWTKWKTITIDPNQRGGGSIDILTKDDFSVYIFYSQATYTPPNNSSSTGGSGGNGAGGSGEIILWQSSSTVAEPPPPPPVPPGGTPGNGTGGSSSTATSSDSGNQPPPPGPASTSSGGVPPPAPNSTSSGSNTPPPGNYYYTPSGEISGSASSTHGNFWVEHVNRNIELGWQDLPAGTDAVIVYRSTAENGPWTELIRQDDPPTTYSIRLLDNTLSTPHWYRMEAKNGTQTTGSYGPTYLPALE